MAVAAASISGASLLNDVVQEFIIAANRRVSIHLMNLTNANILINPQIYTYSGYCHDPPQPTVGKGVTEVCAFGHTKGTARGSVGVMTYDIATAQEEASKRLAIMFSVPFNYNQYENVFALGVFDTTQPCDESLYKLMYYGNAETFTRANASGSELSYKGKTYTMRGTMSPIAKSIIKVELRNGTKLKHSAPAKKLKHFWKCVW
ncbi:hypothetical protein JZ751_016258 [Albula glossodonta]|uniref:Uncharacterized protein n=1 Tax=Albula glossodonta TaxID=121402 RepID=A0A8T2N2S5_9TELE|nr:hypothetical protein JZ751_016258 [Albula glossodonta]